MAGFLSILCAVANYCYCTFWWGHNLFRGLSSNSLPHSDPRPHWALRCPSPRKPDNDSYLHPKRGTVSSGCQCIQWKGRERIIQITFPHRSCFHDPNNWFFLFHWAHDDWGNKNMWLFANLVNMTRRHQSIQSESLSLHISKYERDISNSLPLLFLRKLIIVFKGRSLTKIWTMMLTIILILDYSFLIIFKTKQSKLSFC